MSSVQDLKQRIEHLDQSGLHLLEKWLNRREEWERGILPKTCFVIMPFSMTRDGRSEDYWSRFFSDFLTPALVKCGYKAVRSEATPANIVGEIIQQLAWSNLVLAVLTDFNANVWYELGVRHSLRRGATVMICLKEQIGQLPFDLSQHGVASYKTSLDVEELVIELTRQLEHLREKMIDSPVSGFSRSGMTYCVQRALSGLREVMEHIKDADDAEASRRINALNNEWRDSKLAQVTIIKNDAVFLHQDACTIGLKGPECYRDSVNNNASQFASMKRNREGLFFGSITGIQGRFTAVAYDTIESRGWFVAMEAHIMQSEL